TGDFRKALEAIISRFQEDDVKVSDIYDSKARAAFFDKRIDPKALPSPNKITDEYKNVTINEKPQQPQPTAKATTKRQISIPASNLRKRLINYSLRISHPRINAIYNELKNK